MPKYCIIAEGRAVINGVFPSLEECRNWIRRQDIGYSNFTVHEAPLPSPSISDSILWGV